MIIETIPIEIEEDAAPLISCALLEAAYASRYPQHPYYNQWREFHHHVGKPSKNELRTMYHWNHKKKRIGKKIFKRNNYL